MTYVIPVAIALLGAALWAADAPSAPKAEPPAFSEDRVAQIAEMLAETPAGLGRPADDRAAWAALSKNESYQAMLRRAEGLLKQPIPPSPDDLFLDYSKTGNRGHWERVAGQRRGRIGCLTLAECLENKGRFVPALAEAVAALCQEKTWLMPAHDGGLANFKGTTIDIDLGSSALSWNLAMADWLLGARLPEATRQLIGENLRRRTLEPFLDMAAGKRKVNWWITTTNNWNAVCLAGVTGTALAVVEPRAQRARFVAAAEAYSRNFLAGFTPDGYCSEGLGYWDYGFGHYVLLSETIRQATGGKCDLLARPEAKAPATFPARIEIINGVSPAFADCGVNTKAPWAVTHFLDRRFGLGADAAEDARMVRADSSLAQAMIYSFPNAATQAPPATAPAGGAAAGPAAAAARDYFQQAGILICRPGPAAACRMGVALKGGHNDEHHNHNDVGSYVVVLGREPVLLDPGAEVYTARTFSSKRYDSNVLNSFGHPVPRVAGKLQQTGRQAAARIVRAEFTDAADTYVLDIRSAYPVPELRKLQRTFVYSRAAAGSLTVTDEVELSEPRDFETAIITLGHWARTAPATLVVYDLDEAVRVEIDAGGAAFDVQSEQIKEDMHTPTLPTRIGVRLKGPAAKAAITLRITPEEEPAGDKAGGLLRNGGFEQGQRGWRIPADGLASLSTEQAAGGKWSLKITDADAELGSNVSSARVAVRPGVRYELRGKYYGVSGTGLGMYVRFYDKAGKGLNEQDAKSNIAPVGDLGGSKKAWEPFAFPFRPPEQTAWADVWIHSYSNATVVGHLDDLEIVERQPATRSTQ